VSKPTPRPEARVIGIDCATDPNNVGLALCVVTDGRPRIVELTTGKSWPAIDEQVASWATRATLLALDAPLGWPARLGESLHRHRAGGDLGSTPNALFRRTTDDAIASRLGKRPLDVGSDRIARTAHTALSFLARLRQRLDAPIPLAWAPEPLDAIAAIEVYPAGTLTARNLPSSGYKGPKDAASALRQQLATAMAEELSFDAQAAALMIRTDHALDAVLCVRAGLDFLAGDAVPPSDLPLAKQEGWIWVCRRAISSSAESPPAPA
jgi:predicted nuclease with RNAse H fold